MGSYSIKDRILLNKYRILIINYWIFDPVFLIKKPYKRRLVFNIIGSNLVLFIIISLFFILINSTLLYYSNVSFNHCLVEFISTLFSLLFLVIIISPALIILLDFDLIILPSFIIYSLGLQ